MKIRANGIATRYWEIGEGEPVVLIHGLADDHRAWRRVIGQLMLDRRVIVYNLRGHGGTELGEADGTLGQLGADLLFLCEALKLSKPTLAGFSLGGTIAMRAALDAPDAVGSIALVATSSRVGRAAREWYAERARLVESNDPSLRATLDADTADVYRVRPEEVEAGLQIRRSATADPRGYANACRAMAALGERPLDDELAAVVAPTVVLAGELDQHCPPRAAEIIAARIDGSRLEVLAGCGHPLPVERPDEVAAAIREVSAPTAAR
ncbi:MAG: alpha/beta fold hydrolase [Acidobacteriota bacterium]|nr:alpha/beta fold hydrolase [Acidobacteriota bacterium]